MYQKNLKLISLSITWADRRVDKWHGLLVDMLGEECEWRPIVLGRIKLNSFSLKYLISKTLIISSYVIVVFLIFCIYCILHHWKTIKIKQLINPQKYGIVQTVAVVLILEFCARGKVATFCRNWLFYILLFTGKKSL